MVAAVMEGGHFVRIFSLLWADVLVGFAFFVMQNYLTNVWGLNFTHSAAIMNFFGGVCLILPGFFLWLADAVLGNFGMLLISSISYSLGIGLIALSTPPVLGTCKQYQPECIGHKQRVVFYTGMALVAIGVSGNQVSVQPFINEQKDDPDEQLQVKSVFQIPGFVFVVVAPIVGAIALPYIKPWSVRFGIPAICTLVATLLFLSGNCFYRYRKNGPKGSPVTNICRVYVAFVANITKRRPLDNQLYRMDGEERFTHTRFLRCLEKAAIEVPEGQERNRWRVCSVGEVEEAKIALRMIPMWMTFIICGVISSIGNTYFVEQANNMNRKIGKWNLPPQVLWLFYKCSKDVLNTYASQVSGTKKPPKATGTDNPADQVADTTVPTTPAAKRTPGDGERSAIGIGVAMICSVLCCIVSAVVEKRRLNVIGSHNLLDKPDDNIPMSIYWLLFQFFLLAGLDSFLEKSVAGFYDCQAPDTMTNYLEYFTKGVSGLGFMFSVLTVYVVGKVSGRGGRTNWFQPTLSRSRLDKYYWVLAALGSVNLVVFVLVAFFYRYKKRVVTDDEGAGNGGGKEAGGGGGGGGGGGDGGGGEGGEGDNGGGPSFSCCC